MEKRLSRALSVLEKQPDFSGDIPRVQKLLKTIAGGAQLARSLTDTTQRLDAARKQLADETEASDEKIAIHKTELADLQGQLEKLKKEELSDETLKDSRHALQQKMEEAQKELAEETLRFQCRKGTTQKKRSKNCKRVLTM